PVREIRQNRPRLLMDELPTELIEMIEYELQCPGIQDVGELVRLVRDQVAERDANARNRRLVKRDQRVAERDPEQQLGELEHVIAKGIVAQHYSNPLPHDQYCCEGKEQRKSESQERRLVRRQQHRNGLLHGCDNRQTRLRSHFLSSRLSPCTQVVSAPRKKV